MLIDRQTIGIANTKRKPAKHIPKQTTDKGMSMTQHKQGRNGRISKLFNKLMTRQIQMNNPRHKIHPSIATTPSGPVTIRNPIRHIAPNNIDVIHTQIKPKMIMQTSTTNNKRHSIAALIPISPSISLYLSISYLFLFLFLFLPTTTTTRLYC